MGYDTDNVAPLTDQDAPPENDEWEDPDSESVMARTGIAPTRRLLDINPDEPPPAAHNGHTPQPQPEPQPEPDRSSWARRDLETIDTTPETPGILHRTDGHGLLYPGRVHWLSGDPETGKSWIAFLAAHATILNGGTVLWINLEDTDQGIRGRLDALGLTPTQRNQFIYIHPDEPIWDTTATLDFHQHLAERPTLAVVDSIGATLNMHNLKENNDEDIGLIYDHILRPLANKGTATLALDHPVKDKEQRGKYSSGSKRKLATTDVHYIVEPIRPFARGSTGISIIKIGKDRPGGIRAFCEPELIANVATVHITSTDEGNVTWAINPPKEGAHADPRSSLDARVLAYITANPGLSTNSVTTGLRHSTDGGARKEDVLASLHRLHQTDRGMYERKGQSQYWYPAPDTLDITE